jgi:predicted transcriptional regulator
MDRMPDRPRHELLVAVAGPAVNVVLAAVLALVVAATGASFDPEHAATVGGALASQLLWINVALAAFNLLPAFPMDGGRVLRALLAMRLGFARATRLASQVGRVLAGIFVAAGLLFDPMLVLIGAFVWFAAHQETATVELRSVLAGVTVREAMIAQLPVVDAGETIDRAAELVLASGHSQLAVVQHGQLVGIVTAADLAATDPQSPITPLVRTDIPVVAPDDLLDDVTTLVERAGVVFVVDHDLVGLLTLDQLTTYATLHARRRPDDVDRTRRIPILVRSV